MLDPTCDPDLQELKSAILGDAVVDEYLAGLKRRSIAIVFSGGGGKGAYEAGVMLALFDCGITKFCALSGTSVGALNAVLFHELCRTGSRDSILQLWCDISPWKVMHPTWKSVVAVVVKAAVLAALVLNYATSIRYVTSFQDRCARDREFVPVSAFASKRAYFRWFTLNLLQNFFRDEGREKFLVPASRFSFMTNAPLRQAISELDTNGIHGSTTAIYCTMTTSSTYYNPFVSESVYGSQLTKQLIPVYVALNLLKTKNELTDILMQTAALPEIFPPTKLFGIKYVVDGGLTDNTPIFPVLSHRPNVIVSVYLKRKFARRSQLISSESRRIFDIAERLERDLLDYEKANKLFRAWHNARLVALKKARNAPADEINLLNTFRGQDIDKPTVLRETNFLEGSELVAIIPSAPIDVPPRFVTGTMNFCAKKAQRLIRLGYKDALEQLRCEA
jgi:predicted acylesterase/phospholipase RssA